MKGTIRRWVYAVVLYALAAVAIVWSTQYLVQGSTNYFGVSEKIWLGHIRNWSGIMMVISFGAYLIWNFMMWDKLFGSYSRVKKAKAVNWVIFVLMVAGQGYASYIYLGLYWTKILGESMSIIAIYMIPLLNIPMYILTSRLFAPETCFDAYPRTFEFRRKKLGIYVEN